MGNDWDEDVLRLLTFELMDIAKTNSKDLLIVAFAMIETDFFRL